MRTKTLAIAIALVLLTVAVGAFAVQAATRERGTPISVPTTESGALAHRDAADALAAAWHADARLVGVVGFEGPSVDSRVDPPLRWDTSADPNVGNGAALVWTFAYAQPEIPNVKYWVSIGGDGSTLYARELTEPWLYATPVAQDASNYEMTAPTYPTINASIDAPAAYAAIANDPRFAEFDLDHPVYEAMFALHSEGDRTVWTITYRTATFYQAFALVDANTGEVVNADVWPTPQPPCCDPPLPRPVEPCCRPDDFEASYAKRIGGNQEQVMFPIESAPWVNHIAVTASLSNLPPGAKGHLEVVDSAGRVIEAVEGVQLDFTATSAAVSGTYYVRATLTDIALVSTGLPRLEEPKLTADIAVTYANAPQPAPSAYHFSGEAWTYGENWVPMWFESYEGILLPTEVALTFNGELPTHGLELALLDQWGNEVDATSATGQGTHELVINVPDLQQGWQIVVRNLDRTPFAMTSMPYDIDVTLMAVSWEQMYDLEHGQAHPAHDDAHVHDDGHEHDDSEHTHEH